MSCTAAAQSAGKPTKDRLKDCLCSATSSLKAAIASSFKSTKRTSYDNINTCAEHCSSKLQMPV